MSLGGFILIVGEDRTLRDVFIAWPPRKLTTVVLPPLRYSTCSEFAAIMSRGPSGRAELYGTELKINKIGLTDTRQKAPVLISF
jgi:hypothetical protein